VNLHSQPVAIGPYLTTQWQGSIAPRTAEILGRRALRPSVLSSAPSLSGGERDISVVWLPSRCCRF
jgi:hypothetical protein